MDSPTDIKRRISDDEVEVHVDHRKRRRNRTTLSCLNCHGSKRMCDRRRPACSRCTKLGLSGTCVYEVDDINRRDQPHGELLLLKNRIAELEGFIREFKRKPHPRTLTRRKRYDSVASTAPSSDNGADSDTCSDSKGVPSFVIDRTTSPSDSSSESDNDPRTPSVQEDHAVFLSRNQICSSPPLPGRSTLPSKQPTDLGPSSGPVNTDIGNIMDVDSTFDFGSGFICDDNETLDRVFARIMEQEAGDAYTVRDCQCVKQSAASSAIHELAPHLHRALNTLRSISDHSQISEFGSPCKLLNQLQSLSDSASSIINSPQKAPAFQPSCAPPSVHSVKTISLIPATSPNDSPLERVQAARRAGLVPPPFSERSAAPTPTIGTPKRAWRGNTVHTAWEGSQSASSSSLTTPDEDQFMSWESTPRGAWPRTISLSP